jgi:hypothetical protein
MESRRLLAVVLIGILGCTGCGTTYTVRVTRVPEGAEPLAIVTGGERITLPPGSHVDDDGEVTRPNQPPLRIDPDRDRVVIRRAGGVRREPREADVPMAVSGAVILMGGVAASVGGMAVCLPSNTQQSSSSAWGPNLNFAPMACVAGGSVGIAASAVLGGLLLAFGIRGTKVERPHATIRPTAFLGGGGVQGEW